MECDVSNERAQHELVKEECWRWNYLLIDGVALPEAEKQLYQACENPEHVNLFAGPAYGEISDVGPLLVRVTAEHPLVQCLIEEDFGAEWGVDKCVWLFAPGPGAGRLARACSDPPEGNSSAE